MFELPAGAIVPCESFQVQITDGANFYIQYKDEFVYGIYNFECSQPDPLIIDGGSNMGMSILAFKRHHPGARIVAFEPDPDILRVLEGNIQRNHLDGVTVVPAGLAAESGVSTFRPDHTSGGQVDAPGGFRFASKNSRPTSASPWSF